MTENTINADVTMGGPNGTLLAGRYRVVKQLGQGGMGSVWLAEDTKLDGFKVAIKMLPSVLVNNKRAYRQLKAEALVSLRLSHPNIATVRSFEEEGGNPFLVVDYIEGQTLDDYICDRGVLSEEDVVRLLTPIAGALDYAHGQRVVHRDVKPANIIIRNDGVPFILDFGIAREMQETMTRVTGRMSSGTLMYMSPEQLKGAAPDPAQDVYGFAAMVYECLSDHPPFFRGQIEYQIETQKPNPLPEGISIGGLVMAGLEKEPEARPRTCLGVLTRDSAGMKIVSAPQMVESAVDVIKTSVERLRVKARAVYERVDAYKSDTCGFMGQLSVIEDNWRIVNAACESGSESSARAWEKRVSQAVSVLERETEWLEVNRPLRDECRDAFTRVMRICDSAIESFGKEFEDDPEFVKGRDFQRKAATAFEVGEFQTAKARYDEMKRCVEKAIENEQKRKLLREAMSRLENGARRSIDLGNGVRMDFVYCKPCIFRMGSVISESDRGKDENCHTVSLTTGFWIGATPVTKAQWRAIMGGLTGVTLRSGNAGFTDADHPMTSLSWIDCQACIRKLESITDIEFSLPTESQWECACRAGTTTAYCFGDTLNGDKANCNGRYPYGGAKAGEYKAATTPVKAYSPNGWGIWDMHGNVCEWCKDWYGAYAASAVDPEGPSSGTEKVLRGGSWFQNAKDCRSAARAKMDPKKRMPLNGFRLVVQRWNDMG